MKEGNNLRKLRIRAGYRFAKQFADEMGIHPAQYVNYELGNQKFGLDMAVKFANKFGCSVDEVIERVPVGAYKPRSAFELRIAALDPATRDSLEQYLDFLEWTESRRMAEVTGCLDVGDTRLVLSQVIREFADNLASSGEDVAAMTLQQEAALFREFLEAKYADNERRDEIVYEFMKLADMAE